MGVAPEILGGERGESLGSRSIRTAERRIRPRYLADGASAPTRKSASTRRRGGVVLRRDSRQRRGEVAWTSRETRLPALRDHVPCVGLAELLLGTFPR